MKHTKEPTEAKTRLVAAFLELLNACKVFCLDKNIRAWLVENDPKALEQAEKAIARAEEVDHERQES